MARMKRIRTPEHVFIILYAGSDFNLIKKHLSRNSSRNGTEAFRKVVLLFFL
jgi:hypothetical protein